MTEFMEHFDVKTNFLLYDGVVWCIKLLMNALENQNEKKKKPEISVLCRKLHKSSNSRFSRDVTVLSKYGRSPYLCPSKCEIIWKRKPSLSSFRVFLSCSADLVWIYPRKLRKKK